MLRIGRINERNLPAKTNPFIMKEVGVVKMHEKSGA